MKNSNKSSIIIPVAIFSGVLLLGHALYFMSMGIVVADSILFILLMAGWSFLLNRAADATSTEETSAQQTDSLLIQESMAFHAQLGKEVSNQITLAHTELSNTQAILSDAIAKLVENFTAMAEEVQAQQALSLFISGGNEESKEQSSKIKFELFVLDTEKAMNEFVESTVQNSARAMELVEKMDEMSAQVDGILGLVNEVEASPSKPICSR